MRWEERSRLSLETCRRLLGAVSTGESDEAVIRLRNQLYELAECAVSAYEREGSTWQQFAALQGLPRDDRMQTEERAAILEFDAHLTRRAATKAALAAIQGASSQQREPH